LQRAGISPGLIEEERRGAKLAGEHTTARLLIAKRTSRVFTPYKLWSRSGFLDIKESIDVNSSMINKIAKAKRYAEEPERIQFTQFEATFRGENDVHTTHYNDGEWNCTCRFFHDWGDCSHTMAMQRILGVTIPAAHRHGIPTGLGTGPLAH